MSIIFRASMVGGLMTNPDNGKLPSGAITILDKMVSQKLLDWRDAEFDFFTTEKGKRCEGDSIELYNEVNDTFYVKNVERITKDVSTGLIIDHDTGLIFDRAQPVLTGECDLIDFKESLVIDIKTAYSKATYPLVLKMSRLYEWQLRSYMHLYNVDHAELAYCLVNTPDDLIQKKDPLEWHNVDNIRNDLKVSTLRIKRDLVKENQLINRLKICADYVYQQLELRN